jgi:YHS domain-containing protein
MAPIFGKKTASAKDPVCHMNVEVATAKWTSVHEGKSYYFCGKGCKEAFDANPTAFLGVGKPASHH